MTKQTASAVPATGSAAPLVLRADADGITTLTLNNPARRNALSHAMLSVLKAEIDAIATDSRVRAVILAAEGKVFSSGHDLREVLHRPQAELNALFTLCEQTMEAVRLLPKPVIARVHALASAAGCQLVASCDLVVASTAAAFQTPGMQIGLFCSTPMVPLSRVVPPKKALEMLFTARAVPAEEAERMGLVNRVVPPEQLVDATTAFAHEIIGFSADTLALGKAAFYAQQPLSMSEGYAVGKGAMLQNAPREDAVEGMSAFLEKRKPAWKN